MKKLLFFLIITVTTLTSCSESSMPGRELQQDSLNLSNDTVIKANIKKLYQQLDSLGSENLSLKAKVENSNAEKYFLWLAIGAGIGVLALLVSIIAFFQALGREEYATQEAVRSLRKSIDYLQEELNDKLGSTKNKSSYAPPSDDYASLNGRIRVLEDKITSIEEKMSEKKGVGVKPDNNGGHTSSNNKANSNLKNGYLGTPSIVGDKAVFSQILPTKSDRACFKLSYKEGKEGTFELIDLMSVKSADWIDKVIDISGNCTISEGISVSKSIPGKIIFHENYWVIDSKLKITLKK